MRTIAVCNLKGGVGKTTTVVNLGASLARNGRRVLLIDCDAQGSLTSWLRAEPRNGEPTLYEILRGQATVRAAAAPTRWPNISVVPAAAKLAEIDRGALAGERVLWARMSDDYDYALLDCSASPGVVLSNALTAADDVIVPVQAKGMALGGVARLRRLIRDIGARSQKDVDLSAILVCLFDGRTSIARTVLGELRAKYGDLVFDTVVHENVKLSEAADKRRPITDYAPTSRGAAEYAAIAFELMTREHRPIRMLVPSSVTTQISVPKPATEPFRASTSSASTVSASPHHNLPPTSPLTQD